jgi:hypothetical protein
MEASFPAPTIDFAVELAEYRKIADELTVNTCLMPSNNPNWNTHQLREPVLALEVMFHIHSTQGECRRQIISGRK